MYSTVQKMASCQPSALVHMDGDTMRFGISMGGGNLCLLIKVSVPSLVVGYAALAAGAVGPAHHLVRRRSWTRR